jgi:putative ABC transport system permease protein
MPVRLSDFRFALRGLRKNPGFAAVAIATLALAIGANTAIFSVVDAALVRRLPFPRPDRLAMVWETNPAHGVDRNTVNPGNYVRWSERSRSFAHLAAIRPWYANLSGAGDPVRVRVASVSGEFFPALGIRPAAGRLFGPADARSERPEIVVISAGLWTRRFGGDPSAVGRTVRINGVPLTIAGIAPERFDLPAGTELWLPSDFGPQREALGRSLSVIGRLRDGATLAGARAEMAAISAAISRERPDVDAGWGASVVPIREEIVGRFRTGLLVLMAAVGCLLLIGCANLANLMLARGSARRREFAIRTALGASRRELVRLLLAETTVLGVAGGIAGVGVAALGVRALLALVPAEFPGFLGIHIDLRVLVFTAVVSLLVGAALGIAPALRVERGATTAGLHGTGAATATPRSGLSALLVAAEVALSIVLLTGAALLLRSLAALWDVDPGLRTKDVVSFRIDLPRARYAQPPVQAAFFRAAEEALAALPGVDAAGGISWVPLGRTGSATGYRPADAPVPRPENALDADIRIVTAGFFRTAGVPILRGRPFGPQDSASAPLRAVVSAALVRESFAGRDPVGGRLWVDWGEARDGEVVEIVGVVGDARLVAIDRPVAPTIYFPQEQQPERFMTLLARGPAAPVSLAPAIRNVIRRLDPELPVAELRPMEEVLADSLKQPRFFSTLLGVFSALALLLAAIGVYGLIHFTTARRTREIGIRIALGGRPRDVFALVMGRGMAPVAAGALFGIAGGVTVGRLLRSLLYGVAVADPWSLAGAVVLLAAAALLACAIPARRAARLSPASALRTE